MRVTTADGCQGGENHVVVADLVRDAESGPGFLSDSNRLNVTSTRHKDFFFAIGNSIAAKKNTSPEKCFG